MTTSPDLPPWDAISEAGRGICDYLKRTNQTYDMAPELFHALKHIDQVLKRFDGDVAMAERANLVESGWPVESVNH